jgi:uncharacterized repeat protein (TIGR01451 family)
LGGTTTVTFSLANPNANASLTNVGFTDILPAGLAIATPSGLTGNCGGGMITAPAGSGNIALSGALLAASATCSFSMNVTAIGVGLQNNVTSPVTSSNGGTGNTASASVVIALPPPAANIPTLQDLALAVLGLLLSVMAILFARRRGIAVR